MPACACPCIRVCTCLYLCVDVCMCVPWPPVLHWEAKQCLVLCTYRVLITTNSLEPASSLEGIILNPITYWLRYATEAHNLSSSNGWDFFVMSPESQRTNSETRRGTGWAKRKRMRERKAQKDARWSDNSTGVIPSRHAVTGKCQSHFEVYSLALVERMCTTYKSSSLRL